MVVVHDINIEPIIGDLIVSDDLQSALRPLDSCTRSAIRMDAIFHLADAVLHSERDEFEFYLEIITVLETLPARRSIELPRRQKVSVEPMYRVPDVAKQLGMSEDWVRRNYEHAEGVKIVTSPRRRGKREYSILLIPQSVLDRELRKLTNRGGSRQ